MEEEDLEEMAEKLERLTNNSAILTSSDLIYVSRIMKNIAESPRVTTMVNVESYIISLLCNVKEKISKF